MGGGKSCIVCKHTKARDPAVHMHRFPHNPGKRQQWCKALCVQEEDLQSDARVCTRHFPNGDTSNLPSLSVGKRFASPKKRPAPSRVPVLPKRQKSAIKSLLESSSNSSSSLVTDSVATLGEADCDSPLPSTSRGASSTHCGSLLVTESVATTSTSGEAVCDSLLPSSSNERRGDLELTVSAALLARIEVLEQENNSLKRSLEVSCKKPFRLEDISRNDQLVRCYTGFPSYVVLMAFFDFLGSAVNHIQYWGSKKGSSNRQKKLDPLNCLFLTLIKLRLNLTEQDLAFRFGVSTSTVSRYFITWICFLYNHLKEIEWCPTADQVAGTLPHAFKQKYPTTYIIIDASEIFLETPTDLMLQSSTWSNYKQHNTAKYLVGVTPNGAISFISPTFVGSISDPELTRCSGLLSKLGGKGKVSVMADRGFTIRDQLQSIGVELNIPPFLDGRGQLPAEEVQQGRLIASLRIHVERAIGRMKNFTILKGTFPINMARIANQIVCVCAWLTNFFPPLVPPPTDKETDTPTSSSAEDSDFESMQ